MVVRRPSAPIHRDLVRSLHHRPGLLARSRAADTGRRRNPDAGHAHRSGDHRQAPVRGGETGDDARLRRLRAAGPVELGLATVSLEPARSSSCAFRSGSAGARDRVLAERPRANASLTVMPGDNSRGMATRLDMSPRVALAAPAHCLSNLRLEGGARVDGWIVEGYGDRDRAPRVCAPGRARCLSLERRFGEALHRIEPALELRPYRNRCRRRPRSEISRIGRAPISTPAPMPLSRAWRRLPISPSWECPLRAAPTTRSTSRSGERRRQATASLSTIAVDEARPHSRADPSHRPAPGRLLWRPERRPGWARRARAAVQIDRWESRDSVRYDWTRASCRR